MANYYITTSPVLTYRMLTKVARTATTQQDDSKLKIHKKHKRMLDQRNFWHFSTNSAKTKPNIIRRKLKLIARKHSTKILYMFKKIHRKK